jgi:hypothetical protein
MGKTSIQLTREQLYEKVWSQPISRLAREWGISDVGLAEICKRYNIPRPSLGHWARKQHGYNPAQPPLPQSKDEVVIEIQPTQDENRLIDPKHVKQATEIGTGV